MKVVNNSLLPFTCYTHLLQSGTNPQSNTLLMGGKGVGFSVHLNPNIILPESQEVFTQAFEAATPFFASIDHVVFMRGAR